MSYFLDILIMLMVWTGAGYCFSLPVAHARMFLVCVASMCASGAYFYALVASGQGGALGAVYVTLAWIAVNAAICASLSRLWRDELIIGSFAVQMLIIQALKATRTITGGDEGLGGFGGVDQGHSLVVLIVAMLFVLGLFLLVGAKRSPLVRAAATLGQDPIFAASTGVSLTPARFVVLAVACVVGAGVGALWAAAKGYLTPTDFGLFTSVQLLLVVLVTQRVGALVGPILGAAIVVLLPELIRMSQLFSNANAGHAERIIFGLFLIAWTVLGGRNQRQATPSLGEA